MASIIALLQFSGVATIWEVFQGNRFLSSRVIAVRKTDFFDLSKHKAAKIAEELYTTLTSDSTHRNEAKFLGVRRTALNNIYVSVFSKSETLLRVTDVYFHKGKLKAALFGRRTPIAILLDDGEDDQLTVLELASALTKKIPIHATYERVSPAGRVWFPRRGISEIEYDDDSLRIRLQMGEEYIENVYVDGRAFSIHGDSDTWIAIRLSDTLEVLEVGRGKRA